VYSYYFVRGCYPKFDGNGRGDTIGKILKEDLSYKGGNYTSREKFTLTLTIASSVSLSELPWTSAIKRAFDGTCVFHAICQNRTDKNRTYSLFGRHRLQNIKLCNNMCEN
jgi:hypothetical protein